MAVTSPVSLCGMIVKIAGGFWPVVKIWAGVFVALNFTEHEMTAHLMSGISGADLQKNPFV